jgi:translation initiation factor eIF-2B subunit beta
MLWRAAWEWLRMCEVQGFAVETTCLYLCRDTTQRHHIRPIELIPELAAGNIIRRILRLIREEYRAAAAAHRSAPPSIPGTPYLGPETPGLHAPSSHYLSNDLTFSSLPNAAHSATLPRQPSLSNFVAMRHSRAQLERSGSLLDLSASTSSLFTSPGAPAAFTAPPTRNGSIDGGGGGGGGAGSVTPTGQGVLSRADSDDFMKQSGKLKPVLIQAIEEVVGELETTHEDVAKGAREHIHSSYVDVLWLSSPPPQKGHKHRKQD